jgi:hypothetical protein
MVPTRHKMASAISLPDKLSGLHKRRTEAGGRGEGGGRKGEEGRRGRE